MICFNNLQYLKPTDIQTIIFVELLLNYLTQNNKNHFKNQLIAREKAAWFV